MITNLPRKRPPRDIDDRRRETYFRSEGFPQPQRDQIKVAIFGFVFLLLLVLASIKGNSALFDAVPFGGWGFLVLYLAFHFTYLASVSGRNKMPSAARGHLAWGLFAYLAIIIGALHTDSR